LHVKIGTHNRIPPVILSDVKRRRELGTESDEWKDAMQKDSFICSTCGKEHDGLPLSFAADFPDPFANLSLDERDLRATMGSDQCIIDQERFFIRGCLEIPINGTDEVFLWGLWAQVKEEVFDEISEYWESEGRETCIGPYKGLLANELSIYGGTLNLRVEIRIQPVGSRPLFFFVEPDNQMSVEQHNGIPKEKAAEYACLLLRIANG